MSLLVFPSARVFSLPPSLCPAPPCRPPRAVSVSAVWGPPRSAPTSVPFSTPPSVLILVLFLSLSFAVSRSVPARGPGFVSLPSRCARLLSLRVCLAFGGSLALRRRCRSINLRRRPPLSQGGGGDVGRAASPPPDRRRPEKPGEARAAARGWRDPAGWGAGSAWRGAGV